MKKFLFYYCLIIALFISISGILSSQNTSQLLLQLVFLPVTIYFCYAALVQFIDKKASLFPSSSTNITAIIITTVFFLLLFFISIKSVSKNTMSVKKSSTKISSVPSPKPIMLSYVVLKKEYLNDKINIRKEASSTSEIIGTMDKEKQYQFISKSGLWFKISLNTEKPGFVNDKFVEIKQ
ncbi:MAG: hypothetical protein UR68_C0020G0018 [Candidatus Roizmanbacteria bacterium GW2011_GWA2_35_19]|uniref:SH3b domain-containing protein n=1 Tax=Candidatus Roizmanbacteria bacterium GW2011_GWA2_35_19 TaxID=1618478 RepID=A0A0G0BS11_9BACT|nr:MAG: hypothetical protein UR68_C0020G0018 [Candidatus Roizmanbacteria bacterium GW2011_GWA2_35_19]